MSLDPKIEQKIKLLEEKYADERKQNQHLNNLFERLHLDLKFFQQDFKNQAMQQEIPYPTINGSILNC